MKNTKGIMIVCAAVVCAWCATAKGNVVIETVPVGNPGNAGELSGTGAGGYGPDAIVGAVSYPYQMGKFEITTGQYTAFLNAIAATDIYGLYDPYMWVSAYGCKIERTGDPGDYAYSVLQIGPTGPLVLFPEETPHASPTSCTTASRQATKISPRLRTVRTT